MKTKVNISFKTTAPVTNRTIQITDAFGLGIDEEKIFTIYKDVEIEIQKNDIVYITGDSGAGKSLLLQELKKHFDSLDIIDIKDLKIKEDEILIENIGDSIEEAIKILSLVGLNDAYLFLRRYNELSDGQKYRYKIAKLINSKKGIWFLDEFVSLLDRDMAKIIAFNLQKLARKTNKTVIVATAHSDLYEDLSPSLFVHKKFEDEVKIVRSDKIFSYCSVVKDVIIKKVTKKDIIPLLKFHYKNTSVSFIKKIYGLYLNDDLIACIVYSCPNSKLHGRFVVFGREFQLEKGYPDFKKINKEISLISRVVVHPKYRSIGLGYYLVKSTLDLIGTKIVESIATMSKYNPFFEKAGMTLVKEQDETTKQKAFGKIKNQLVNFGFDLSLVNSRKYNKEKLEKLSEENFLKLKETFYNNRRLFAFHGSRKADFAKFDIDTFASYIPKAIPKSMFYWYWTNKKITKE